MSRGASARDPAVEWIRQPAVLSMEPSAQLANDRERVWESSGVARSESERAGRALGSREARRAATSKLRWGVLGIASSGAPAVLVLCRAGR